MADRYFVETPIDGAVATLTESEAHHLIHVMRAKKGTKATLFDGSGAEFLASVERVGRADVDLRVLSREQINRELPVELIVGVALPKGDRQKWLVEKATELGVTRLVPLKTERSVAQPVEQALSRLRRSVVEASKQCGRNKLMEISDPMEWPDFTSDERAGDALRLLAHPNGYHRGASQLPVLENVPAKIVAAIGPEGGLANDEVTIAVQAGWHTVDLGPRILRVETAALLVASMVIQQYLAAIEFGDKKNAPIVPPPVKY